MVLTLGKRVSNRLLSPITPFHRQGQGEPISPPGAFTWTSALSSLVMVPGMPQTPFTGRYLITQRVDLLAHFQRWVWVCCLHIHPNYRALFMNAVFPSQLTCYVFPSPWNRMPSWCPIYVKMSFLVKSAFGTCQVVQWIRIHLSMQGIQVRSLVQEDPTCCGATKPMPHNYWSTCA